MRAYADSYRQADGAHELDCVALTHYALAQLIVESHLALGQVVFEMDIADAVIALSNPGNSQIVRRHQSDRAGVHQCAGYGPGADPPIMRICAVQNLVEQKQARRVLV